MNASLPLTLKMRWTWGNVQHFFESGILQAKYRLANGGSAWSTSGQVCSRFLSRSISRKQTFRSCRFAGHILAVSELYTNAPITHSKFKLISFETELLRNRGFENQCACSTKLWTVFQYRCCGHRCVQIRFISSIGFTVDHICVSCWYGMLCPPNWGQSGLWWFVKGGPMEIANPQSIQKISCV